jgi:hypothetical protein
MSDGSCDDGGPGSQGSQCLCGSDESDCGSRTAQQCELVNQPLNDNSCAGFNYDGFCDDGGSVEFPRASRASPSCPCGSDTFDCGVRSIGEGNNRFAPCGTFFNYTALFAWNAGASDMFSTSELPTQLPVAEAAGLLFTPGTSSGGDSATCAQWREQWEAGHRLACGWIRGWSDFLIGYPIGMGGMLIIALVYMLKHASIIESQPMGQGLQMNGVHPQGGQHGAQHLHAVVTGQPAVATGQVVYPSSAPVMKWVPAQAVPAGSVAVVPAYSQQGSVIADKI